MALIVGKLTAQLDLEDDRFRLALDKAKLHLAAFPQRRTVELRLDESAFNAAARRAEVLIARAARPRTARITVDAAGATAEATIAQIARTRTARIRAEADTSGAASLANLAGSRSAQIRAEAQTSAAQATLGLAARDRTAVITAVARTATAESALSRLARDRKATITAVAKTATAESALTQVARARRAQITADAEVAASEAALTHLARDRTATIHTNVNGGGPNLPGLGGGGAGGGLPGGGGLGGMFATAAAGAAKASAAFWAAQAAAAAVLPVITQLGAALGGTMVAGAGVGIAALAAYGVATATLKVGLSGIKEAAAAALDPEKSKEFWAAMEKLSPAARQSMLAVRGLGQAWEQAGVKAAVQEKLFAHLGPQIGGLSKHIGAVKASMLSAAGGFNAGAKSALTFANSAQGTRQISTILTQSGVAAGALGRAAGQLAPAFLAVGSSATRVFSQMAVGFGASARSLSNVAQAAERSGKMDAAFRRAADTASDLGRVLAATGGILSAVFSAASASSGGLDATATSLAKIRDSLSAGGEGAVAMKRFFEGGRESAEFFGAALRGVATGMGALFESAAPGLSELRGALESAVAGSEGRFAALGELISALASSLASAVPVATAFGQAFASGLSISVGLVQAIMVPLSALAGIVEDNKGAVTALAAAYIGLRVIPGLIGQMRAGFAAQAAATATASTSTVQHTTALQALGGAAQRAHAAMSLLGMRAVTVANANGILVNSMGRIVTTSNQGSIALGRFGSAIARLGAYVPVVQRMQAAFIQTALAASVMARTAGVAAAALTGLKAGGSAVAGLFGGPLGLALTAAAIGGGILASKSADAAAAMDRWKKATDDLKESQLEMGAALKQTQGAVDGSVMTAQTEQVKLFREQLEAAAEQAPTSGDQIRRGLAAAGAGLAAAEGVTYERMNTRADDVNKSAGAAREAAKSIKELGLTNTQLAQSVYGSQGAYDMWRAKLVATASGGEEAGRGFDQLREKFLAQQAAAARVNPAVEAVAKAFQTLGDKAATAAQKSSALQDALDRMAGVKPDAVEANKRYYEILAKIDEESTKAWDATDGLGKALVGADGRINQAAPNGRRLTEILREMKTATADVGAAGEDIGPMLAENNKRFEALAKSTGLSVKELKDLARATAGYDEKNFRIVVGLTGKDAVTQDLGLIKAGLSSVKNGETIDLKVGPQTAATEQILDSVGAKYKRITDANGDTKLVITADDKTRAALDDITARAARLSQIPAVAKITADGQAFDVKDKEVRAALTDISAKTADPKIDAAIEAFLQGKNVTLADLVMIDRQIASPEIRALVEGALRGIRDVGAGLAALPSEKRIAIIEHTAQNANGSIRQRAAGALDTAQIANGRGAGKLANTPLGPVQWAEGETDWEAFIPGARSKRARSLSILAETARRFGLDLIPAGLGAALAKMRTMADGGVATPGVLKQFARGIDGETYVWGGWGNGWKTDCSGGQSSLMERATGRSMVAGAKHRAGTASFDAYTRDHGLKPGLPPAGTPAYSVGWNEQHTSGTIHDPAGGDVNVEMGGSNGGGKYDSSVGSKDISGSHAWMPLQGDPGKAGDIGTSGATSTDSGTSGYGTDGGKGSSQNVWVMNWPSKIADPAVKNAVASAVLTKYAQGGVEDHRAQIAPAGAMRLWAEPETGGEAYIPLAADKRPRSLAIWRETGRRLGVGQYALGGFGGHQTPEMIAAVQPTEHAPGYYAEQAYRLGVAGWGTASMIASAFSGGKFNGFSTGSNSIPQLDERLKELAEKIEKGEKVSVGIYVGPGGRIVVDDQDELLRRQKAAAEDALNRRGSSV